MGEHILVVGRDCETLIEVLLSAGYDLAVAATVPEALSMASSAPPELVIARAGLRWTDLELMRRVATGPGGEPAPLVLLLPSGNDEAVDNVAESGASDVLREPIISAEVLMRVRSLCRQRVLAGLVRSQKRLLECRVDDLLRAREDLSALRDQVETALRRGPVVLYSQEPVFGSSAFTSPAAVREAGLSFVDDGVYTVFGHRSADLVDSPRGWAPLIHPADRRRLAARARALLGKGRHQGEYRILHGDGRYRAASDEASLVRNDRGEAVAVVGCLRDLSREREAKAGDDHSRRLVRRAQRMDGAQQLAGSVAHDFNNLLSVMVGYCQIAARALPEGHVSRNSIDQVLAAVARAQGSTRLLVQLAKQGGVAPAPVSVNAAVRSAVQMAAPLLGDRIRVETRFRGKLPTVFVDRTQLEQVILNLCINARDAMPKGGTLVLATDLVGSQRRGELIERPTVSIEVTDSGTGMDDETLARCFEPFFTTKSGQRGTGLGLYNVLQATQQWGGSITVETELGKGTTFRLLLQPRSRPRASMQEPAAAAHAEQSHDRAVQAAPAEEARAHLA